MDISHTCSQTPTPLTGTCARKLLTGSNALLAAHTRQVADELDLELFLVYVSLSKRDIGDYQTHSSDDSDASLKDERYGYLGHSMALDEESGDFEVNAMHMDGNRMETNLDLQELRDILENEEPSRIEWDKSDYWFREDGMGVCSSIS